MGKKEKEKERERKNHQKSTKKAMKSTLKDFLERRLDEVETLIGHLQLRLDIELGPSYRGSKPYYRILNDLKSAKYERTEVIKMLTLLKADLDAQEEELKHAGCKVACKEFPAVKYSPSDNYTLKYSLGYTNYRCILVPRNDGQVVGAFWTPELLEKEGVENSHHCLMNYLCKKYWDKEDNQLLIDDAYHWAGFYCYGRGNADQEFFEFYGESCDYPNSDRFRSTEVLNSFKYHQDFWWVISPTDRPEEENDELPF